MDEDVNGSAEVCNADAVSSASSETPLKHSDSPGQTPADDEFSESGGEPQQRRTRTRSASVALRRSSSSANECASPTKGSSSAAHAATANNSSHNDSAAHGEKEESRRRFRLTLRHPGEWRKNDKLWELFSRAERFHIWFEQPDERGLRVGGASLTYDSIDSARNAFQDAHKIHLDGQQLKLQASKSFYDPVRSLCKHFTPPEDVSLRARTVYALNLVKSAHLDLLKNIFGEDIIERLEILPQNSDLNQAELVLVSSQKVEAAIADGDGFDLDDGDQQSVLKVLGASEYVEWARRASKPQPFAVSSSSASQVPSVSGTIPNCTSPEKAGDSHSLRPAANPPPSSIPESADNEGLTEEDIVESFSIFVHQTNLNWAEVNEKEEFYAICDKISHQHGGLPDSQLKPALLAHLEAFKNSDKASSAWMRRHLETLIKTWKGEVLREGLFERPSRIPLAARSIAAVPVAPHSRKRRGRAGADSLRARFGVGALLQTVRVKFTTEEGELDIDEDDSGAISIGGTMLSFDSWAQLTKASNRPRVVAVPEDTRKRLADDTMKMEKAENRKAKRAKLEEERRKTREEKAAQKAHELDEGEIASDEEKKAQNSSSGNSSTSSSSSSDSDENDNGVDSRRRRRNRRRAERKKPPSLPPFFQNLYENRVAIISALSMDHRRAFIDTLTQISSQKGGINHSQQQQIMTELQSAFGQGASSYQ